MPNEKLIAALPLAALFAALCHTPPAAAEQQEQQEQQTQQTQQQQQEGMVIVRDQQTGQWRAPTADEMKALRPHPAATLQAPRKPALVTHPDGTRHVRIGPQGMVYSVVTRDADGNLVKQCVQGEAAAGAALEQKAAGHDKEHSHETR